MFQSSSSGRKLEKPLRDVKRVATTKKYAFSGFRKIFPQNFNMYGIQYTHTLAQTESLLVIQGHSASKVVTVTLHLSYGKSSTKVQQSEIHEYWVHSIDKQCQLLAKINRVHTIQNCHGAATNFSATPALVCRLLSGHQMPAVFFHLQYLADVVCCWASTILVNAACTYGPFLAGGNNFGCQFWSIRTNFCPGPNFLWQTPS